MRLLNKRENRVRADLCFALPCCLRHWDHSELVDEHNNKIGQASEVAATPLARRPGVRASAHRDRGKRIYLTLSQGHSIGPAYPIERALRLLASGKTAQQSSPYGLGLVDDTSLWHTAVSGSAAEYAPPPPPLVSLAAGLWRFALTYAGHL